MARRQQRQPSARSREEGKRYKRHLLERRIIVILVIISEIALAIATTWLLLTQGLNQSTTALSIIITAMLGLPCLMYAHFQWRHPITPNVSDDRPSSTLSLPTVEGTAPVLSEGNSSTVFRYDEPLTDLDEFSGGISHMGRRDKAVRFENTETLPMGARLRLARQNKDISITNMAKILGYSRSYLSTVENGLAMPPSDLIEKYKRALDIEEDGLLMIFNNDTKASEPLRTSTSGGLYKQGKRGKDSKEDWGEIPLVSKLYGRESELTHLKQLIAVDQSQIVAILGLGGIGKTTLASGLTEQIKSGFKFVFWRSLQNAPPVVNILTSCIQFVSSNERTNLPPHLDDQIRLLIEYLRKYRCLIILDNLEAVLGSEERTDQYLEDHKGYGTLLQRIGEVRHQSCLLLTSREKPKEIAFLEAKSMPVRSIQLTGLGQAEAKKILQDKELLGTGDEWKKLIDLYAGNPLALKLVSEFIREICEGSIGNFLEEGEPFFGDVHELLNQQFARLSGLESEIMYWLTIERGAVSLDDLQEDLAQSVLRRVLLKAIDSLQRRFMIEKKGSGRFIVQPVIMEYVTGRIIEQAQEEIDRGEFKLLDRHALIKAQAKEYIRESQVRSILNPVVDRLRKMMGKDGCEERLKSLLSTTRETRHQPTGYRAGNLLNLLLQLRADLRDSDFSHLTIRQAYLQGMDLPGVNFTHTSFARTVFTETFGSILSVAVSKNGEYLAAGTADGMIRIWHITNSEPLYTYQEHKDWVRSVAFSPDGSTLASGSDDRTIRFWDTGSGQCLRVLKGHEHRVRAVAFSPDGGMLASGSDDLTIRFWNINNGKCFRVLQGHAQLVRTVTFSPDGSLLASGSEDRSIRFWNISTGQCSRVLHEHSNAVRSVVFTPDGDLIVSGSDDQTIRFWDVGTGQCLKTVQGYSSCIYSVAFSPDGMLLASGNHDHKVRIWNVSSKTYNTLHEHSGLVYSVSFNPAGNLLASGSHDHTVCIWDVGTGQCLKTLRGHSNQINSVAFSPNGTLLVSGSEDNTVCLWEVSSGRLLNVLNGHTNRVRSVAFSPNGTLLASGSEDTTIRLWDVGTKQPPRILQGHSDQVRAVAFSPDGTLLVSGSEDNTVRLWKVSSGRLLATLNEHTDRVRTVAFSPDGTLLASGSEDTTIRLWNASSRLPLGILQGHRGLIYSVAFSQNNKTIASGSYDGTIKIWDIQTERCLQTLRNERPYEHMNIQGVSGLTVHQKKMLKVLGAIED